MEKKRMYLFLIITFVLTFGTELGIIYPLYRQQSPELAGILGLLKMAVMLLPAVGVLLTCYITKDFKGIWFKPNGKKSVKYFFAGYFLPSIFIMAGAAVYFLVFPDQFDASSGYLRVALSASGVAVTEELIRISMISNLVAGVFLSGILNFIPTLGEELGWRGYLLPKLLKSSSPGTAILINGVIWGLWHGPLIAMGHNYSFGYWGYPVTGILAMCVFCMAVGAFLSYLTIRTKSCLPAVLGHGTLNGMAAIGYVFTDGQNMPNPFIGPLPVGILGGSIFIVAAVYCILRLQREYKKGRKGAKSGSRTKKAAAGAMLLLTALLVGGCGAGENLSSSFSEEKVKEQLEIIVNCLNERDFEAVGTMVPEEFQNVLNGTILKDSLEPYLEQTGEFQEISSVALIGDSNEKYGGDIAIAVATCKYADKNVVYTISFDKDYKLIGIYMK